MNTRLDGQVMLPELATTPAWARRRAPSATAVQQIKAALLTARAGIAEIGEVLASIPGPTADTLIALPTAELHATLMETAYRLQQLDYDATFTEWLNETCTITTRAVVSFDQGLGDLQRLYHLRPSTKTYRDCLAKLRWRFSVIAHDIDTLSERLDALPARYKPRCLAGEAALFHKPRRLSGEAALLLPTLLGRTISS